MPLKQGQNPPPGWSRGSRYRVQTGKRNVDESARRAHRDVADVLRSVCAARGHGRLLRARRYRCWIYVPILVMIASRKFAKQDSKL